MKSLKKLILIEDVNGLDRYNQYDKSEGDPAGAADDLKKLLDGFISSVESALAKSGPFMAETVLNDFLLDLKERTKPQSLKMPTTSSLSNIMSQLDQETAAMDQADQEKKAASKTAPAAKEKPAVAAPPPPEDEGSEEEEAAPGTPAVTGKTPHKRNIKVP